MVTVSCRNINDYNIGVLTISYQYHIDIGKNFIVSAKYSVRSFGARVHGIQRSVIDPGQSIDTYVDSLRGKMGLDSLLKAVNNVQNVVVPMNCLKDAKVDVLSYWKELDILIYIPTISVRG
ncbi:hypothetical protein GLOIN_2v1481410 [Rhizophagus irregularis DAOM 181602=DAOM 197198]|nr:hypothetical protein GLOIN_2v1481410 [Rhizophagus irregularis DAOM 181602=DAOM 197198]